MIRLFITCGLVLLCANGAMASPWPREKGKGFTSVTATYRYASQTQTRQSDGGFYLEYGLGHRLTVGIDATDTLDDYTHAYGFIRWPLTRPEARLKMAVSVGAGASRRAGDWGTMTRIGFAMGQDIRLRRYGWWSVIAAVEDHALWDDPVYKLESTVGLPVGDRFKALLDFEASDRRGSTRTTLIRTSIAWQFNDARHFVIGLEVKDSTQRFYGIRAGLWHQF